MNTFKRFMWTVAAGGLLGAILAVWFSPGLIEWYFSPPTNIGISCKEAVPWAIESYRKVVFAGILLGGIFFGLLFFAFSGRGKAAVAADAPGVDQGK
ncbi:MAG: hypothetical protein ACXVB9_02130 [Bdellovibrionota bacterium]